MPSVAHVRDISQHAEGYPSRSWGKAFASLGLGLGLRPWRGDFVLLVLSWLLVGYSEASCRCRGELIQGKGRGGSARVKMWCEVHLIYMECFP